MPVEDVIFLGAGASAADGAPLQNQLFRSYFQHRQLQNDEISDSLRKFFKDFFGIIVSNENDDIDYPTFEEILGILELAIARGESFKHYPLLPGSPKIQSVREQLIFLVARILKETLKVERLNHDRIVRRLAHEKRLSKTAFISLNYDILIDNAITDAHAIIDLDYGISFTNFRKKNDWHKPRKGRSVVLYKLHGSLNWLYCPTCIAVTITPKEKSVSTLIERPIACKVCYSNMIPIIIPPTFFKVMSNYYLQLIWRSAENTLRKAERIFFCGYSFPDADVHIKYLLKRVELNRGRTPEIFIINNHSGKHDANKLQEESRYKRFFSNKQKIHYLNLSFEEFCDKGIGKIQAQ